MANENIKVISNREDIVAIADNIRTLTGVTGELTLAEMATAKGSGSQGGVNLPELTNPASEDDLLQGKELIDEDGNIVTGTMPTATQATPSITVNSSGLITASATQTAGYVAAGTKSATKQLTTQAAKTITPSTLDQVAISSGVYATGAVTVKGDANLVAANIVSGKSIFGVAGTATTGGSGSGDMEDALVTRNISTYTNNRVTTIGIYAFHYCSSLTSVSFPNATTIGSSAFYNCYNLTSVSFPNATTIGIYAFYYCSSLTSVSFPKVTTIGNSAFQYCYKLTSVSFPKATSIGSNAFNNCSSLTSVSFPKVTSISTYAFNYCSRLTSVSFPKVTSIGIYAFSNCSSLTTVSFPKATSIGSNAFSRCLRLTSLYLTNSTVCTLSHSNAFTSTPIGGYSASAGTYGSIYVPASLLTSYKNATNWTYFSSRFVGI